MANRLGLHDAEQAVQGNVLDGASDSEDVRSRQRQDRAGEARSSLEQHFDPTFATRLALREKQIQPVRFPEAPLIGSLSQHCHSSPFLDAPSIAPPG